MTSPPDRRPDSPIRTYTRANSIVFLKTRAEFGGLSNMAGSFPLEVNGIRILTSEALYQACRFPHRPDVQRLIIGQTSPMTAKMKSKPYRHDSRPDWDKVRVKVMRWCLRVKLAQNWARFSELLMSTGDCPIVEESRKDDFWGAKPIDNQTLVGMNVLGRLLMELREEVRSGNHAALLCVRPLAISDFLLSGQQIKSVVAYDAPELDQALTRPERTTQAAEHRGVAVQSSLFSHHPRIEPVKYEELADKDPHELGRDIGPYPAYKDSGVPSLGKVPEHWEVQRLGALGTFSASGIDKKTVEGEPLVKMINYLDVYNNLTHELRHDRKYMTVSCPEWKRRVHGVRRGDIFFTPSSETVDDIGWSAVAIDDLEDTVYSYHVIRFRLQREVDFGFRKYLCNNIAVLQQFSGACNGTTRKILTRGDFRNIVVTLPPLDEQRMIVCFLDYVDRRIRRYIRAKQKLIALLNEQKQAIIHRAVTGGLDPSVPLKPSGIPWLGDIPQHWEVRRLKFVASKIVDCLHATPRYSVDGTHPAIRTADIASGVVHLQKARRISSTDYARWTERLEPIEGDILYSREGERFGIGACVPAGVRICISQRMMVFRIANQHCSHFVMWLLNSRSTYGQALQDVTGATAPHVNISTIRNYFLAVPSGEEQEAIVHHIELATRPIDVAVQRLAREIELLREYRTRLIADVVTGKLDVREAAWRLPKEVGPGTAEDDGDLNIDPEAADEEAVV
jgi:type I restriction enzyme S subunit